MAKPKKWTEKENDLLRQLYPSHLTKDIAHLFGTTPKLVADKAFRLGLKKNSEMKSLAGKINGFSKGNIPFNKGLKWNEYMSEEGQKQCARTQFKKGSIPPNIVPFFTERITKDGYVEIKVPGHKGFMLKHRWVWEQHYGAIPEDCQIHFKDGNRKNFDLSNLELVTEADNALRNGLWNRYPKEVATLIQLKGALNRQINKHKKSNQ